MGQRQIDGADEGEEESPVAAPAAPQAKRPWPRTLPERILAVRAALSQSPAPLTTEEVARQFQRAQAGTVAEVLTALHALGHARQDEPGRYSSL